MKRILTLILLCSWACASYAIGEVPGTMKTSVDKGRYEVLIPDNCIRYTFKLDKYTGDIWQLVKRSDDSSTWEIVSKDPSVLDEAKLNQINYQLIIPTNAPRYIMLVNINTGITWQICKTATDNIAFQLIY